MATRLSSSCRSKYFSSSLSHGHRILQSFPNGVSVPGGCAARLDGLNLSPIDGCTLEAGWQLRSIEKDALWRVDVAQGGGGQGANALAGADALLEGTVLLGVVAVGGERVVRVTVLRKVGR
jgi:hypothetical protein